MGFWERMQPSYWGWNEERKEPEPVSERDLLLAQALTALENANRELAEARRDAAATLDRIVTARYDRVQTGRPAMARPATVTPLPDSPDTDTDESFLRAMKIGGNR